MPNSEIRGIGGHGNHLASDPGAPGVNFTFNAASKLAAAITSGVALRQGPKGIEAYRFGGLKESTLANTGFFRPRRRANRTL